MAPVLLLALALFVSELLDRRYPGRYAREATVPWAELRWPPEAGDPWGDSPTFPPAGADRR